MGMGCQPSVLESTVDDSEIRSDSEMLYESASEPENTEPIGEETKLLESSKDVQISKQVRTEDESGLLKVLKL